MSRLEDVILRDTRANQPAATAVAIGAIYCVTDEAGIVERSNGTVWQSFSPTSPDLTSWTTGPWTLDDVGSTVNVAGIRPADPAGGTYNDWAPTGIDTAVVIEVEPSGNIILTGISQATNIRRLLGLINRDSASTITLSHANAGSAAANRFDLPDGLDIVLAPEQAAWLYYNTGSQTWQTFITPQSSGALALTVLKKTLSISEAQLETLFSVPVTVIAAPGAGKVIVPIAWHILTIVGTSYSNAPTAAIRYAGSATNLFSTANITLHLTGTTTYRSIASVSVLSDPTFDASNKAVIVALSADPTGTGVATAKVTLVYTVEDYT